MRSQAALLALAGLLGGAGLAAPAPGGLDALLHLLAQHPQAQASFTEEQHLATLKHPLRSQGLLIYQAPDRLEERTLEPHRGTLRVEGDRLTVQIGANTRHLQLQNYPQVAPYIDAIRATLAGDRATLERLFHVHFTGTLAHWRLELQPRSRAAADDVSQILMQGHESLIDRIEMRTNDGDRSVMRITARP